jgi:hypothetical protein
VSARVSAPDAQSGAPQDRTPSALALTIMMLLLIHLGGDILFGFERGETVMAIGVLIGGAWLAAVLALGPRAGYALVLLIACLAPLVPLIHMSGTGISDDIEGSDFSLFLFVFSLLALGAAAPVSITLSIQGLWRLRRGALSFFLLTTIPLALGAGLTVFALLT